MKIIVGTILIGLAATNIYASTKSQYEGEFKKNMSEIIKVIEDESIPKARALETLRLYPLKYDTEFAEVEMKRKTLKDKFGRVKCALNFPVEKRIEFNKECWEKVRDDQNLRKVFVFHEYLGLSEQEVDSYELSSLIVDPLNEFRRLKKEEADRLQAERNAAYEKQREEKRLAKEAEEAEKQAKKDRIEQLMSENMGAFKERLNSTLEKVTFFTGSTTALKEKFPATSSVVFYSTYGSEEFALIDVKDIASLYLLNSNVITNFNSNVSRTVCEDLGFYYYPVGHVREDLQTAFLLSEINNSELKYTKDLKTEEVISYGRYDKIICRKNN